MGKAGFYLNGRWQAEPNEPLLLLDLLREGLHLPGTRAACREGECGSCQVLYCEPASLHAPIYRAVPACLIRAQDVRGGSVITIEGLGHPANTLNPLQRCLTDNGASQCGFCSPGLVIGLLNWLLNGTELNIEEGEAWLNGNLCRCTGYMGQRRAIDYIVTRWGEVLRPSAQRVEALIQLGLLPALAGQAQITSGHAALTRPAATTTTTLIGGGTDLYLEQPLATLTQDNLLIGDNRPALGDQHGRLMLSARHSIAQVAQALAQAGHLPVFTHFNATFATLPVRNRATLGGNLAHASPVGDGITLLLAMGADIRTDRRTIAIDDFISAPNKTCLLPGEIIEWIVLPADIASTRVLFDKVGRRGSADIAVVNCAGRWRIADGRVVNVRLVIGGASPIPVQLPALQQALHGLPLETPLDTLLALHLPGAIDAIDDLRGSAHYRHLLARQLIQAQWLALREATMEACNDLA